MRSKYLFAGTFFSLYLCVGAQTTATQDAQITKNNNAGLTYKAELLEKENSTVRGRITTRSGTNNVGIKLHVDFWGIPEDIQYLTYHIHQKTVPDDGNCYSTGPHLDPYKRGDKPPCNISAPQTCEVGDLSGKHGPVYVSKDGIFKVSYTDFFLSNVPDTAAYFGNRSITVHTPDSARVNCGNFQVLHSADDNDDHHY